MKKSQTFLGRPIILVSISIISIIVLIFGIKAIGNLKQKTTDYEVFRFYKSLDNTLKRNIYKEFDDFEDITFSLPGEVTELCFVDINQTANPSVNAEVWSLAETYSQYNLFLSPTDRFRPFKLKYLALNSSDNPLCIKNKIEKVKLRLISKGNKTAITASSIEDKERDCVSVQINGNPDNKIDVVFLGYAYKDIEDFSKDINKYLQEVILSLEPFQSNADKFNFYRVDKIIEQGCTVSNFIRCDEFEIKKLAALCPNDHIFILMDKNTITNLLSPVRSSAISNMIKINTADSKFVVIHEFGHTFGGLADEYVDDPYYRSIGFAAADYPNCDINLCPKWADINNTECVQGCSTSSYYRGTTTSIMRDLSDTFFGPINEFELQKKLDRYENE